MSLLDCLNVYCGLYKSRCFFDFIEFADDGSRLDAFVFLTFEPSNGLTQIQEMVSADARYIWQWAFSKIRMYRQMEVASNV